MKKVVILLILLALSGVASLVAQDENNNVLDQAREKYKNAQMADNQIQETDHPDPVASEKEPAGAAQPAETAKTVDSAEAQNAAPAPTARRTKAFSFQPIPGFPHHAADAVVGIGVGLTVNRVAAIKAAQISLIGNIANESVIGFQGSSLFNYAGDLKGLQTTGVVNIAGDVEGVQMSGVVNVAKKVKGLQIGLVNISDDMDGLAIGLINVSRTGINEIPVWYTSSDFIYAGLQMGGRNVYLLLYGGALREDWFRYYNTATVGASLGVRGKLGPFYLQGDAGIKSAVYPSGTYYTWNYKDKDGNQQIGSVEIPGFTAFGNARLTGGFRIWGPFSVFAGVNMDIDGGKYWHMPAQYKTSWNFTVPASEFSAHFSWIFGISL